MVTTRSGASRLSLVMPDPSLMPPTAAGSGGSSAAQDHLARLDWRQLQLDGPQALDAVLPVELQVGAVGERAAAALGCATAAGLQNCARQLPSCRWRRAQGAGQPAPPLHPPRCRLCRLCSSRRALLSCCP
jgi:hypothetical protein